MRGYLKPPHHFIVILFMEQTKCHNFQMTYSWERPRAT